MTFDLQTVLDKLYRIRKWVDSQSNSSISWDVKTLIEHDFTRLIRDLYYEDKERKATWL